MANDLNQCNFIGRMPRDPETRFTPSGVGIVSFSLAVNKKYKDRETVAWVNCKAFGKTGEIIAQYCTKGSQLYVQCEYNLNEWETAEGEKRRSPEFIVRNFQFLGGKQGQSQPSVHEQAKANGYQPQQGGPEEDIPF